jgi:hypothetical protein
VGRLGFCEPRRPGSASARGTPSPQRLGRADAESLGGFQRRSSVRTLPLERQARVCATAARTGRGPPLEAGTRLPTIVTVTVLPVRVARQLCVMRPRVGSTVERLPNHLGSVANDSNATRCTSRFQRETTQREVDANVTDRQHRYRDDAVDEVRGRPPEGRWASGTTSAATAGRCAASRGTSRYPCRAPGSDTTSCANRCARARRRRSCRSSRARCVHDSPGQGALHRNRRGTGTRSPSNTARGGQ